MKERRMSLTSKLLLGIAALMAVLNLVLAGVAGDWALPVMVSISASPALRPNRSNLLLAVCALIAMLVSQLTHNHVSEIIAILAGICCMGLALLHRVIDVKREKA